MHKYFSEKSDNHLKKRKYLLAIMSTILSVGFLCGCNGVDENEPDPTEEPSEEIQEKNNQ
ncbi:MULTISPECIES: hypothetical protein [unclassified Bacillus (in: firmicutes)]|nr:MULTISPECIES: hypothetical protein [unclassified Bacillus (in: firmicutes)]MCU0097663.1 hypothetical protein [Bacillus sp. OR9]MCU5343034.1 hypothetical protein [Bacillus cereus]MDF2029756.1 hypothetical protein [Bacillus sp. Cr_R16]